MKFLVGFLLTVLPSCGLLPRSTPSPVPVLTGGKMGGSEMVVFLPGRWSRVEEFEREGFFEIARNRWPEARLVAADLHLSYYLNRSMPQRLHEDVILPARRSGVKKLTLVGVSMGGLGALIYEVDYPDEVDEIILLSPFVGDEKALDEIAAAGNLKNWQPGVADERDFTRKLWLKLRVNWQIGGKRPKVLLGCGTEDRLAESNRLFAREFLNPSEQKWIPGTHDWPTWRPLFESLIGGNR